MMQTFIDVSHQSLLTHQNSSTNRNSLDLTPFVKPPRIMSPDTLPPLQ